MTNPPANTPPEHSSPSAPKGPPATPRLRSTTTPTLATPEARQHTIPPATPGSSTTSPFPARMPRTPGGTVGSCTFDRTRWVSVTVHTAKCSECDQRNRDTMRRCPGCTFQVCKPCLELRENEGRGLMHGNMMSSGGVATPTTQRTVRKKPLASTPGGGSGVATKTKKEEEAVPAADGEGSETKKAGVNGKKKEKAAPAPAPRSMVGTERAAQKKRKVPDIISEGSPSSSLDNDDEDFELGRTSPTPSKRRRTGLGLGTASTSPATTSRRAPRKPLLPAMPLPRSVSHPSITREPRNASSSMTSGPIGLTEGDILYEFGVKGYDEPLLGRREPVVSNPVIKIPDIVKRNFKPRPTADEIQRNIQKHTLKKMQEMHEERLKQIAAQRTKAEEEAYPHTVREFVESEAMKHKDDDLLDRDEHEALCAAMRDAARKWAYRGYDGMDAATQKLVTRGLDMRLDMIDESYKTDLIQVLDQCAARKLQEMAYERAPTTALAQN